MRLKLSRACRDLLMLQGPMSGSANRIEATNDGLVAPLSDGAIGVARKADGRRTQVYPTADALGSKRLSVAKSVPHN